MSEGTLRSMIISMPPRKIHRNYHIIKSKKRRRAGSGRDCMQSDSLYVCSSADEGMEEDLWEQEITNFMNPEACFKQKCRDMPADSPPVEKTARNPAKSARKSESTRVFGVRNSLLIPELEENALARRLNEAISRQLSKRSKQDVRISIGVAVKATAEALDQSLVDIDDGIRPKTVHDTKYKKRLRIFSLSVLMRLIPFMKVLHKMRRRPDITTLPAVIGRVKDDFKAENFMNRGYFFVEKTGEELLHAKKGDFVSILDETRTENLCFKPRFGSSVVNLFLPPAQIWDAINDYVPKAVTVMIIQYATEKNFTVTAEGQVGWVPKEFVSVRSPVHVSLAADVGMLSIKCKRAYRWSNRNMFLKHTLRNSRPGTVTQHMFTF